MTETRTQTLLRLATELRDGLTSIVSESTERGAGTITKKGKKETSDEVASLAGAALQYASAAEALGQEYVVIAVKDLQSLAASALGQKED